MAQNKTTRTPVQERGIQTKQKIIDAARKLFREKGYFKTNSKEIAREAGVSTGSFYMYYPDKKPLFLDVFQSYYHEISEKVLKNSSLEKIVTTKDRKKAIHELIMMLHEAHKIDPSFHREAMSMIYTDDEIREVNEREEEKVISLISGYLELHKDELSVKNIEAAARIMLKSAEEVIHSIKIFGSPVPEKKMLDELVDMLYRYLFC